MSREVSSVDEYIAGFGPDRQRLLQLVREAIHRGVPGSDEKIRYGMAAIVLHGRYAIHFAGWKGHLGIYPIPALSPALEAKIAPYRREKDGLGFAWTEPIPFEVIEHAASEIAALHRA